MFLRSNKGKSVGGTKEEEEENEGLALLIPDIQETAKIVHSATEKLREHDGKTALLLRVRNRKVIFLFLNQNIFCWYSKKASQ